MDSLDLDETMERPSDAGPAGALKPGAELGQYRVIRLLGRGGMGEVYEVEHTTLELHYALKLLPEEFAARAGSLDRFRREAKVMAKLQHPHIVQVDDFGESNGRYWLRMERVGGLTIPLRPSGCAGQVDDPTSPSGLRGTGCLAIEEKPVSLQDYAEAQGGRIAQDELLGILTQVVEGLAYAHEHGAIHRDLKPSNILLAGEAPMGIQAKIADFGLVRLVGEEWVRSQAEVSVRLSMSMGDERTMAGADAAAGGASTRAMLGTYEYMSPEQKQGIDADERSDVYALGLMTYRLLTGRGLGMKTPSQVDSSLAPEWDAFVRKALEEEPGERYASAVEMGEGLNAVRAALYGAQARAATAEREARNPPPVPAAAPAPAPAVSAPVAARAQAPEPLPRPSVEAGQAAPAQPESGRRSRRLNRAKYFWLSLTVHLIFAVAARAFREGAQVFLLLGAAAQFVLAAGRLHDLNRPGLQCLLLLLPFYNIYLEVVLLLRRGTKGPNRYGPDPLGAAARVRVAAPGQWRLSGSSTLRWLVLVFVPVGVVEVAQWHVFGGYWLWGSGMVGALAGCAIGLVGLRGLRGFGIRHMVFMMAGWAGVSLLAGLAGGRAFGWAWREFGHVSGNLQQQMAMAVSRLLRAGVVGLFGGVVTGLAFGLGDPALRGRRVGAMARRWAIAVILSHGLYPALYSPLVLFLDKEMGVSIGFCRFLHSAFGVASWPLLGLVGGWLTLGVLRKAGVLGPNAGSESS
ncbi:MAG: protein kinase [Kiritimatiellae bacterium]|nr:protein kinase [Kiritimatiellia bacterium]